MKRILIMSAILSGLFLSPGLAQRSAFERTPLRMPDIMGYRTLKCDFHMHTVFSDGRVWPEVRVDEAWAEGLDAIAITEHIEYQRHRAYVVTDHNAAYEIAKSAGDASNILVIKGSEITRSMPPGHINAIFITNSAPLNGKDWREDLEIAHNQGGFIFMNHPCWTAQQPDGVGRWYPEHSEAFDKGQIQGVEVVNSSDYCPQAHQWALDKNLTMLASSDIHPPIHKVYDIAGGDHRPITLVFARERSLKAIEEALWDRRTVVMNGEVLIGREDFLRAIFAGTIEILTPEISLEKDASAYVQIRNPYDIDINMVKGDGGSELEVEPSLRIPGGKTALLIVGRKGGVAGKRVVPVSFEVENMWIAPGKSLPVSLDIEVNFKD